MSEGERGREISRCCNFSNKQKYQHKHMMIYISTDLSKIIERLDKLEKVKSDPKDRNSKDKSVNNQGRQPL